MTQSMPAAPIKAQINVAVLEQIDVRVGTVESVSPVEGADKLVKLEVNFGNFAPNADRSVISARIPSSAA